MKSKIVRTLFASCLVGGASCGSASVQQPASVLDDGIWAGQSDGGVHVTMTIQDGEAALEFDCASGGFTVPGGTGDWQDLSFPGTYSGPLGGPAPTAGTPPESVLYQLSRSSGNSENLELTILESSEQRAIGPFHVKIVDSPILTRCP